MQANGVEEARRARRGAEERLAVTREEVTVPLLQLHRENHVDPLIRNLIRRRAVKGAN